MLCRNPYIKGHSAFPCGRCGPCLDNRKRLWVHRIILEASLHEDNCFVTLTYNDEHLPKGGSLAPEETRNWLKRLRFKYKAPLRYYLVGEYGGETWRPHYHAALFGYPGCLYGMSRYTRERTSCCPHCDLIRDTWGLGFVSLGSLGSKSANYIAGYVTKKMTRFDDPRLPPGLHPEFARMSTVPGLGADAMEAVAETLAQFNLVPPQGDVPSSLRHGKRMLPLGRYLRRKLRQAHGLPPEAPESTLLQNEENVLSVLAAAGVDTDAFKKLPSDLKKSMIKNYLFDDSAQRVLNNEARKAIFQSRRKL